MAGETQITMTGNLVNDPELRFLEFSREFEISDGSKGRN